MTGHTHDFTEILSTKDGAVERRCACGARLWEPNISPEDRFRWLCKSRGFEVAAATNLIAMIEEAGLKLVAK